MQKKHTWNSKVKRAAGFAATFFRNLDNFQSQIDVQATAYSTRPVNFSLSSSPVQSPLSTVWFAIKLRSITFLQLQTKKRSIVSTKPSQIYLPKRNKAKPDRLKSSLHLFTEVSDSNISSPLYSLTQLQTRKSHLPSLSQTLCDSLSRLTTRTDLRELIW